MYDHCADVGLTFSHIYKVSFILTEHSLQTQNMLSSVKKLQLSAEATTTQGFDLPNT